MNRKRLLLLITIPAAILLLLFLLNLYVKHRIEDRLNEFDSDIKYEDLDVNIFTNRYQLVELKTRRPKFSLDAKNVIFKGVSYSSLISNGELIIDRLEMQEPQIIYYEGRKTGKNGSTSGKVKIGVIQLTNGNFRSKKVDTAAGNSIFLKFPEVRLKPHNKIPDGFDFDSYRVLLDSVFVKINRAHFISTGSAEAENGKVQISDFKISSFYSKKEFDREIPFEKDRIDLKVPTITMNDLKVKRIRDTFQIGNSKMTISEALLEIYRNKLVPEGSGKKTLYNEMLRKAPVKINLKQVLVEKSEIIYEELVQESRPPAAIRFTNVEGEVSNLQNISDSLPQPQFTAQAHFMRGTPVSLSWSFPVFDPLNKFETSGEFGEIEGEALDPFLVPAMNVQARGKIKKVLFNFYGNENVLEGDFAMDYARLQVELLKNEGNEKKNIMSALANLMVDNKGEAGFQKVDISVERNTQRSYWNYLWLGLRQGFLEIVKQF